MPGTCLGTINIDCIKSDEKNSVQKQLSAVVNSTKTTSGIGCVSKKHVVVCCSILLFVNFYTQQLMGIMMQWATRTKGELLQFCVTSTVSSHEVACEASLKPDQRTQPSWDGNDISYTLYSPHINSASGETALTFLKGFYSNLAKCQVDFFKKSIGHSDLWRGSIHQAPLQWYNIVTWCTKGECFFVFFG